MRKIVVVWKDRDGVEQREVRPVYFDGRRQRCTQTGIGYYVRWNRRYIAVGADQTELRVDWASGAAAHKQHQGEVVARALTRT